jgi:hypothetical protein
VRSGRWCLLTDHHHSLRRSSLTGSPTPRLTHLGHKLQGRPVTQSLAESAVAKQSLEVVGGCLELR